MGVLPCRVDCTSLHCHFLSYTLHMDALKDATRLIDWSKMVSILSCSADECCKCSCFQFPSVSREYGTCPISINTDPAESPNASFSAPNILPRAIIVDLDDIVQVCFILLPLCLNFYCYRCCCEVDPPHPPPRGGPPGPAPQGVLL